MIAGNLPKSAYVVLYSLANEGPMPPKEISKKAAIPLRTVSFALKKLRKMKLCRKTPNLMDMRQPYYHVDESVGKVFKNLDLDSVVKALPALIDWRLKA